MADLYGTQEAYLEEQGLADAEDEGDFNAKVRFFRYDSRPFPKR